MLICIKVVILPHITLLKYLVISNYDNIYRSLVLSCSGAFYLVSKLSRWPLLWLIPIDVDNWPCWYFKFLLRMHSAQDVLRNPFFVSVRPKQTETPSCVGCVSVCFVNLYNFCFGSWTETKWNWNKPNRPKWGSTGQQNQIKAKQREKINKKQKKVRLCYYNASCPKLLVSVQQNSEN